MYIALAQQTAAGVWMTLFVLAWDLCVAGLIALPAMQARLRRKIPLIERLAALVLACIALMLAGSPLVRTLGG